MSIEQKLEVVCANVPAVDEQWDSCARTKMTKGLLQGAGLGTLVESASRIGAINEDLLAGIKSKMRYVVGADHGLCSNYNISPLHNGFVSEVSGAVLNNKSAASISAKASGVKIRLIDAGIKGAVPQHRHYIEIGKRISNDITVQDAFSRDEALEALGAGLSLVETGVRATMDCIAVGSLGPGAEVSATALLAAFSQRSPEELISEEEPCYKQRREVLSKALARTNPEQNAIDLLACLGGADIAALAGICLSGAFYRRPIVLDGLPSLVAGILATELSPEVRGYLFSAQEGYDEATDAALEILQVPSIIDMGIGEGDGTASAIALSVLDTGVQLLNRLPGFKDVRVTPPTPT